MTRSLNLNRTTRIRRVLWAILAANWTVAVAKLAVGVWSGAAAITADGLHSFIDGGSNVLGLVAMSVAARPADDDHPYGHGKFEAIASLGIGAMIGVAMLELGRMAFASLIHDTHPTVSDGMVGIMVLTLVVNLVVTRVERRAGEELKSPLLLADARHTLSDVFVSLAVLVSVVLVRLGVPRADGAVALVVLLFVAKVAYGIVKAAVEILSDSARLDPEKVGQLAVQVQGVLAARDVRSRGMEDSVWVDLTIEVDPSLVLAEAHALADAVERRLSESFPQVVDVVVHVEPAQAVHEGRRLA